MYLLYIFDILFYFIVFEYYISNLIMNIYSEESKLSPKLTRKVSKKQVVLSRSNQKKNSLTKNKKMIRKEEEDMQHNKNNLKLVTESLKTLKPSEQRLGQLQSC